MTRGENFIRKGKLKNDHRSAMSNIAWCDLNKIIILRLHDHCGNPKYKCQKQITFTPNYFQIEGAGFKKTIKKSSMILKKCGKTSLSPD